MTLLGLTPLLQVFDMSASLGFYRDQIGFEVVSASPIVETAQGRFSHWCWLRLGAVDLMLNTAYDSNERPPERDAARWGGHEDAGLFLGCPDIDAAHAHLVAQGVPAEAPSLAPYGLKRFTVRDPDGYPLTFQEPARAPS
jgi:uncharacterized glyoxalase superfamily protein PhnB